MILVLYKCLFVPIVDITVYIVTALTEQSLNKQSIYCGSLIVKQQKSATYFESAG
jgi:hypothetical protein